MGRTLNLSLTLALTLTLTLTLALALALAPTPSLTPGQAHPKAQYFEAEATAIDHVAKVRPG